MLQAIWRHTPAGVRTRVGPAIRRARGRPEPIGDAEHPERLAVLAHVRPGRVAEIGCGPRKSDPSFVGVDLTPGGVSGSVGNAVGRASQANIAADGARLPFRDGSLDGLVARHNLEHYVDLVAVLREWARVLGPEGRLVAVVPDEGTYPGRTVELDPTHYHSFDAAFARSFLEVLGWEVLTVEPCIDEWSLLMVAIRPRS